MPQDSLIIDALLKEYTARFNSIVPGSVLRDEAVAYSVSFQERLRTALRNDKPVQVWDRRLASTLRAKERGDLLIASEKEDIEALSILGRSLSSFPLDL